MPVPSSVVDQTAPLVGDLDVALLDQARSVVAGVAHNLEAGSPLRQRLEAAAGELDAVRTELRGGS
jgi:hypothetical protein